MRPILACTLLTLLALLMLPAPVKAQGYGDEIECRSRDRRYNECGTGFRGAAVLVRQISNASCVEGRTWGQTRGGVWVDQGCSGIFAEDYGSDHDGGGYGGGHGDGGTINCKSRDYQQAYCALNLGHGDRVYLERQQSKSPCVEGRSWGYDERGIWVSQGCDGYFRVERRYR